MALTGRPSGAVIDSGSAWKARKYRFAASTSISIESVHRPRRVGTAPHDEFGRQHDVVLGAARGAAIAASSRVPTSSACSATGWRIVDRSISSAFGWSSKPMTATSWGTRRPSLRNARSAP